MVLLSKEVLPREPGHNAMCHASTILELRNGALLAAWFAGTYEAKPDVDIWLTRRQPEGQWSKPEHVSMEQGIAHWNPVLAQRRNGDVVLFYKLGFRIETWKTMVRVSKDFGTTWSEPQELVPGNEGGRGPVRNKVVVLDNGTWVAGASLEKGPRWTSFADVSDDEGQTWRASTELLLEETQNTVAAQPLFGIEVSEQSLIGRGIIQPTLWQGGGRSVHMLLRSTEGFVYRSDSPDFGLHWCQPYATSVPNNNSGIDVAKAPDGRLFLVHNPISGNWGQRTPIVISSSADGGSTWKQELVLDRGEGEFSYPAIIASQDKFLVSWTRDRKNIGFAVVCP